MINRMSLVKFSGALLRALGPLDSYLQPVFYVTLQKKKQYSQKSNPKD